MKLSDNEIMMKQKNIKIKIILLICAFVLATIDAACAGLLHADHGDAIPHTIETKAVSNHPENPHNQTHLTTDNCCYSYCLLKNTGYEVKAGHKYDTTDVIMPSDIFVPWALSFSGIIRLPREKIYLEEFTSSISCRAPPFQLSDLNILY